MAAKAWMAGGGLCLLVLGGCATQAPPPVDAHRNWLLERIDASASRVADAEADLARMHAAQDPAMVPSGPPAGVSLPGELTRKIFLHWNGGVGPAVRSVAAQIGYRVVVIGVPSPSPVLVQIDTDADSAYDILQSIGLQCGDRAGVLVDPATRKVFLVWNRKATKRPAVAVSSVGSGVTW